MRIQGLMVLFQVVLVFLASSTVFAEQLLIPGTGANEIILGELAAAFNAENPGHEVIIPPSVGSGGAIRLVGTDKNIIGRVARPIKDNEVKYGLESLVFAKDMVVFAVGAKVGIHELSSQQLADVFSGKVENWQDVGGNDTLVRLLIREPEDSSLLKIKEKLAIFREITFSDRAKMLFHDYEMVNALNKFTTVIGWLTKASMAGVDPSVTLIKVNGIAPTQENVYDGKYPLTLEYGLVYKKGNLNGLARKFVDFIFSSKGSRVLVEKGLVPVNQQK